MCKLVIIKIEEKSADKGFSLTLRISEEGDSTTIEEQGSLPSASKIIDLYNDWRSIYRTIGINFRINIPSQKTNISLFEECNERARRLYNEMNIWLKSDSFRPIREKILEKLSTIDEVRLLIQTGNHKLQQIPWHLWDIFERYPNLEIAISSPSYEQVHKDLSSPKNSINILAIVGNSWGIDVQEDQRLLQNLSGAKTRFLTGKKRVDLYAPLFDENWDILFFAGHSYSKEVEGDESHRLQGNIYINQQESLSILELKYALGKALVNGLKVAIFNSCDGLGLAQDLMEIKIPQMIVMREPIPDRVAHIFLKHFLLSFSNGNSFYLSVREAREKLQSLEHEIPCATWLPVIFQNPAEIPPTWEKLQIPKTDPWILKTIKKSRNNLKKSKKNLKPHGKILIAASALLIIFSISSFIQRVIISKKACLFRIGDSISCGEEIIGQEILGKREGVEEFRKGNYNKAAKSFLESWELEGRDPETLIYLNNAALEDEKKEYNTIAINVPVHRSKEGKFRNSDTAKEFLRGVAHAQTKFNLGILDNQEKLYKYFSNSVRFQSNKKGLKVVIIDDGNDKSQAISLAKEISERSEIKGVIGHFSSEITLASVDIYNNNKLVLISPGTTTEKLTKNPVNYFFRTTPTTRFEAQYLSHYLYKKNIKFINVFHVPSSPFSADFAREFKSSFDNKGGKIKHFDLSEYNFDAEKLIRRLQKQDSNAVLLIPDGEITDSQKNAFKFMNASNGRHVIFASTNLYNEKTLEIDNLKTLNNINIITPWHPDDISNLAFSKEAVNLWGGPVNSRTALSYDATIVFLEALKSKEILSRKEVYDKLSQNDFSASGATGKVEFCPHTGNRKNPSVVLVNIKESSNNSTGYDFFIASQSQKNRILGNGNSSIDFCIH